MQYYVLNPDHSVRAARNLMEWARYFEGTSRIVAVTYIGKVRISTVFLGIDHRFPGSKGPPLLFETMVFGGPHDGDQWRHTSWDDAETHHKVLVKRLTAEARQE